MPVYSDNSFSIGRTPLVKLNRVTGGLPVTMLAKIEGRNPAYSVKCRIGASMIWDAEKRGVLTHSKELIEPTSGNTGIALAFVGAARGYKVTLLMPETMSLERRKVLRALGAKIILTEGSQGMQASIKRAEEMVAAEPDRYVLLQQFQNPANPQIHFTTTGPEIFEDTGGKVDALVAGIGTGGTITGISRYFKLEKKKTLISIGVEPEGSPVISQTLAGRTIVPGPHGIQGIGAGFIPATLDMRMLDRVVQVSDEEAIEMARRLAREEGILSGISCGAAVAAAVRVAREAAFRDKVMIVILPDAGERYLSSALFDGIVD
jgi:cysteine synthase